MARPQSTGIPYFPIVTEWDQKIKLMRAKYGLQGVGCIIELWKAIYSEGYALAWDEDARLLFADENSIPLDQLEAIVLFAVDKGIFNKSMLENNKVLTSHGIQKQWIAIVRKAHRIDSDIEPELCLLSDEERSLDKVERKPRDGVLKYSGNPAIAHKSIEETTQSKAKQSKVKKRKAAGDEIDLEPATDPEPACLQFDIQELEDRIKSAPFTSSFSSTDYEAFAARLSALSLDLGFVDYCIDRIARDKKTSKPAGLLKAGILKYDDWHKEYRDSMPSPSEPLAPEIEQCECGAQPRCSRRLGEAVCTCGRSWTYDRDFKYWVLDPVANVG